MTFGPYRIAKAAREAENHEANAHGGYHSAYHIQHS